MRFQRSWDWRTNPHPDAGWHGRPLGRVHRTGGEHGFLTKFLGMPRVWPKSLDGYNDPMDMFSDDDIEAPQDISAFAVAIASDGTWEALEIRTKQPTADAIAAVLDADDSDVHSITTKVMGAARDAGLSDNATTAVACITTSTQTPPPTPTPTDKALAELNARIAN